MQVDPSCISQAMMLFESWTTGKGLSPCVTDYVACSPSANRCGSAAAAIRPLKSDIERIGSRLIFQRASRGAWRRKRAGLRNWSWSRRSTRVEVPSLRPARRSPDHGEARTGMSAMCRPGRSRISVFGRCVADKTGEGEECPSRRRRTLQPKPPPLRAARPAGRAAGACRRAARDIGAKTAVAGVHRRPPTSSMWRRRSAGSS